MLVIIDEQRVERAALTKEEEVLGRVVPAEVELGARKGSFHAISSLLCVQQSPNTSGIFNEFRRLAEILLARSR